MGDAAFGLRPLRRLLLIHLLQLRLLYNAGAAFKPVAVGTQSPEQGLRTFRAYLDRMRKTPRPV